MKIIPAILEKDQSAFVTQLDRMSPYYSRFHIDIADNTLIPNTTLGVAEIGEIMRTRPNLSADIHCMVRDIEGVLEAISQHMSPQSVHVILVHAAANPDPQIFTSGYHIPLGLVINEDEQVDTIAHTYPLKTLENIQIMMIKLGFQGSPFIPSTLQKLEQLRGAGYRGKIYLDGSVNDTTISTIMRSSVPADFACCGSYFSRAPDIQAVSSTLQKAMEINLAG